MRAVVIDGQGGGLGKAIVEALGREYPALEIVAVGTNAIATSAMLKAGAQVAVTGENAALYNCARADVIIGPLGAGFANSLHGEISPAVAQAIALSDAHKILVPISRCNVTVVGVREQSMSRHIEEIVALLGKWMAENDR